MRGSRSPNPAALVKHVILAVAGIAWLCILIGVWLHSEYNLPRQIDPENEISDSTVSSPERLSSDGDQTPASPVQSLRELATELQGIGSEHCVVALQSYWRNLLKSGTSNEEIARNLIDYLNTGEDMPTGLPFTVGPSGILTKAPTLRVQSLDWLGQIAAESAASYSRSIFEHSKSADEWAIALRNYGRILDSPNTDTYYTQQILKLINNVDWQVNPTRGYLEAFDAAVFSANPEIISNLLDLSIHGDHPGTSLAATMAIDSICADNPMQVAEIIMQPGSPVETVPTFRASLMSRLDPRDTSQVEVLRHYFSTPMHSAEELETFVNAFPNVNDFASYYLLTDQAQRNLYDMALMDKAALGLIQQWMDDPAMAHRADALAAMDRRLKQYVESAITGGYLSGGIK